jgi:hypothetical protein
LCATRCGVDGSPSPANLKSRYGQELLYGRPHGRDYDAFPRFRESLWLRIRRRSQRSEQAVVQERWHDS